MNEWKLVFNGNMSDCREMLINIQTTKWSVMITLVWCNTKQSLATEGLASVASFVVPVFQINSVNN